MTLTDYLPVAGEVPEFAGGVIMVAMAIALVLFRFSHKVNRALALYLVLGGFEHVWAALDNTPEVGLHAALLRNAYRVATLFALIYLAARFRELEGNWRFPRWAGATLLIVAVAVETVLLLDASLLFTGFGGLVWGMRLLVSAGLGLWFTRAAIRNPDAVRWGSLIAGVAFSLEPAFMGTVTLVALMADGSPVDAFAFNSALPWAFASVVAVATAVTLLRRGPKLTAGARGASRAAYTIIIAAASAIPLSLLSLGFDGDIVSGVWQLALPLLLGYAILRHQLLDLDAKVRWGVSRSTVAATFVAAFFVVSEAAQALFADFAGDELLGIAAAGALVFALAPLQRFADRVAVAAVPASRTGVGEAEERYRTALRMALADGRVSRAEERHLAELQEELSLSPVRALELREAIEDGGAPARDEDR